MRDDSPGKIRLVIVDDHPTYREGLRQLLEKSSDMICVGLAGDGEEAVRLVEELLPDVALVDVNMPKVNGIETTRRIKSVSPLTSVLIISAFDYPAYVLPALKAGAAGYVLKSASLLEIVGAIHLVHARDGVLGLGTSNAILADLYGNGRGEKAKPGALHPREQQILKLIATGLNNREIAARLVISERTVQTHVVHIYGKLEVGSRSQAVIQGIREGWITVDAV